jgi:hypothetical protein
MEHAPWPKKSMPVRRSAKPSPKSAAAGGIVAAATHAGDKAQHATRERQAREGDLLLSVRVTGNDARRFAAEAAMTEAGGADAGTISRANALPG